MNPIEPVNLDTIRMSHYFYFAGAITVIVLGALGTISLVLGILKIHVLKPYLRKYPYESYKSFEEFAQKKPASLEEASIFEDPRETIRKKEERMKNEPSLTWDNVAENIASLSAHEYKVLRENPSDNANDEIVQKEIVKIS